MEIVDNIKQVQAAWNKQRERRRMPIVALADSLSSSHSMVIDPVYSLDDLGIERVVIGKKPKLGNNSESIFHGD